MTVVMALLIASYAAVAVAASRGGPLMATWRGLIAEEMQSAEDAGPLVACTLDDAALDCAFDNGYGGVEGRPFTAWSLARVYFPVVYDGSEWVGSAPRHPCGEATNHQGGG